ncbi:jg16725 [Pararge aegeria aegeria]|uniref:Jg16725 protein n=1 Tax=Pararge aegeria aegeria TaxID=348720 RepID=A0A8S4S5L8_9NEOP|nr:jg16725 [Pararge aegeria aegeria]
MHHARRPGKPCILFGRQPTPPRCRCYRARGDWIRLGNRVEIVRYSLIVTCSVSSLTRWTDEIRPVAVSRWTQALKDSSIGNYLQNLMTSSSGRQFVDIMMTGSIIATIFIPHRVRPTKRMIICKQRRLKRGPIGLRKDKHMNE